MRNTHISRRTMLRGLGATIALPFLEAMLPRTRALGAIGNAEGYPVRFGTLFFPNGVDHKHWDMPAGKISALSPLLSPLESVKEKVIVIQGVNNTDYGHVAGMSSFHTGHKVKYTPNPADVDVGNASIDQIIARANKGKSLLPSLEVGLHGARGGVGSGNITRVYATYIAWKDAKTPVPHEINPQRAFDRLFKNARASNTSIQAQPANPAPDANRSVLDLVLQDAKALSSRLGRADQQKLEEYLTAVREVEQRITDEMEASKGIIVTPTILAEIQKTRGNISQAMKNAVAFRKGDQAGFFEGLRPTDYPTHSRLMMDVIALAFWSNSTSVATFMFGDGTHNRNMSFLPGVDGAHHGISHHGYKPEQLEKFRIINKFFIEQSGYLLNRLATMKEGNSTVLDNSVILIGSNICDGQNHKGKNIPLVVAGGGGGRLKGGRVLQGKGEPVAALHRSILDMMNINEKMGEGSATLGGFA